MKIKEYEVIINEKNGTCGYVIDLKKYPIEDFLNTKLQYEVFPKEKSVKVFNTEKAVFFENLNEEMVYYAFKTIDLALLGGVDKTPEHEAKILISSSATLI